MKRNAAAHKPDGLRAWLPELLIAGAVCLGGYLMVLEPAQRQLSDAEQALQQRRASAARAGADRTNLPRLSARLEKISREVATLDEHGRPARDQGELFSRLSALAFEHGVRMDRLTPGVGGTSRVSARRSGAKGDASKAPEPDAVVSYDLAVVGTYAEVLGFVDALQREAGFARVRQVTATPLMDPSGEAVLARIRTEHFAFDAAPVAAPTGVADAEGVIDALGGTP